MSSLPTDYASPLHLPFNRDCLAGQLVMQSPEEKPCGPGFGVLLQRNKLFAAIEAGSFVLPYGAWPEESSLYLGLWKGQPCYLVDLKETVATQKGLEACSLVDENPRLPIDLLSLGGMGRMILHWHKRSLFCGYCGGPTTWVGDSWGKSCRSCAHHMFPAIHPCSIVLVTRPGEVLLTRKPTWAPNRYSLVAGFQEFGESLEETALREITEETGVIACNPRYVGSQSWPFPSQVMVGYVADYVDGEIEVDKSELADARWFPVTELPTLPPKRSIARFILDNCLGLF